MQMPATQRQLARFGPFEVDLTSHELFNDGCKIKLQEKPFHILAILLEHPGQLVTREEFCQKLWPSDTFVDFEHSINTAVNKLREALEQDGDESSYIETLPKLGYRFIAPVTRTPIEPQDAAPQVPGRLHVLPEIPQRPKRLRWYVVVAGMFVLVAGLLVGLNIGGVRDRLSRQGSSRPGPPLQIEALAVLPLQNLSHDPDQEYFADGLTDALITDLGKVSGLRVISHTSAISYRKTNKSLPEIARELNVGAVVEGTVLRSGDRVRITIQLVRAVPEEHLWAERYERAATEVIPLEQQLALEIAHEVSGRLITAKEARLASKRTVNPQAYDAYLHGRYLWNSRTEDVVSGAGAYFEQALRLDPSFALAFSGLADYYSVSWGPWCDIPRGAEYARKAVALDPNLAEAHASLGIAAQYSGKFDEAERELRRSIELNPNYVMAHHWYALHLLSMGRAAEALEQNDQARQLDPFSLPVNFLRGAILMSLHQYDRAVEQLETANSINPEQPFTYDALERTYWIEGKGAQALAEERKLASLTHSPEWLRALDELDAVYAKAGTRAAQLKALQGMEEGCRASLRDGGKTFCNAFRIACQYGLLKYTSKTLYWLDRAFDQRTGDGPLMFFLKTAPEFDFLRSDPRFRDLLHRMGLPE
jgi:TolB-like protein/DNA-binding winged helix-turn-helix (wHTH) protein/Tfp pilus assembly protein PilF